MVTRLPSKQKLRVRAPRNAPNSIGIHMSMKAVESQIKALQEEEIELQDKLYALQNRIAILHEQTLCKHKMVSGTCKYCGYIEQD